MKRMLSHYGAPGQRGSTLIMSLIVLVVLMMLGVATMIASGTQSSLSGNLQFQDLAVNRTEVAVASAEQWLATPGNYADAGFTTYGSGAGPHLYPVGAFTADPLTMTWSDANSRKVDADGTLRYFIELLSQNETLFGDSDDGTGLCKKVNVYRIVARGESFRGAVRMVQDNFAVLSCPPV